jgi:predicted phage terminase large subunit-like protein
MSTGSLARMKAKNAAKKAAWDAEIAAEAAERAKKSERAAKLELLALIAERARRKMLHFTLFTYPGYKAGWFHRRLASRLDQFLADVEAGKSPRLIIEAPPRSGKSELVSRRFPAFALGKNPDLSIIATSYASDLASSMNRDVQRVIDSEEYQELFPETSLNGSNVRTVADGSYLRNSDIFEVVKHKGVYKSAGVGAGITGRGGEILLVDDPLKDAAEAHSQTVRDGILDWFKSTLYTRCAPGGGILIIMTRWHMDDLAGHLLDEAKKDGEHWDEFRFPAIAEEDEYDENGNLLRKKDEALHPERFGVESLARIKRAVGSRVWAALYQQRPSAAEGNIFKRENWKKIRAPTQLTLMTKEERKMYLCELGIERIIQRWDTALGEKKKSDYSACVTLGVAKSRYYVLNVWKAQLPFPDVKDKVKTLFDMWNPVKVVVEGGGSASGKATVQTMKRETRVPLFEVPAVLDKVLRAELMSPNHESGLVWMFENEDWTSDFEDQCANFPAIKHDDDVDAFVGALEEATGTPGPMQITDELLAIVGAL